VAHKDKQDTSIFIGHAAMCIMCGFRESGAGGLRQARVCGSSLAVLQASGAFSGDAIQISHRSIYPGMHERGATQFGCGVRGIDAERSPENETIVNEQNVDQKGSPFHKLSVVRSVELGWSEFAADHDKQQIEIPFRPNSLRGTNAGQKKWGSGPLGSKNTFQSNLAPVVKSHRSRYVLFLAEPEKAAFTAQTRA
jgi:hypothetical protein